MSTDVEDSTLAVDLNEPQLITSLLAQSIEFEVGPLNTNGDSDYTWLTLEGTRKQVERKTWAELLGSIDAVEEQMQRHLNERPDDEHVFLLEGMAVAMPKGVGLVESTKKPNVYIVKGQRHERLAGSYAWLYEIGKYVEVVYTPSGEETATMLLAMYNADQKEEHRTLQRHIKKADFHPNPQVLQLMGVAPGLGEKRASALIRNHGTVWNVLSNKPDVLMRTEGIGKVLATRILKRIGRPDV